jgi:hypothetical protein
MLTRPGQSHTVCGTVSAPHGPVSWWPLCDRRDEGQWASVENSSFWLFKLEESVGSGSFASGNLESPLGCIEERVVKQKQKLVIQWG